MKSLPDNVDGRKQYVANALGVGGVAFFDKPDGEVRYDLLCIAFTG